MFFNQRKSYCVTKHLIGQDWEFAISYNNYGRYWELLKDEISKYTIQGII